MKNSLKITTRSQVLIAIKFVVMAVARWCIMWSIAMLTSDLNRKGHWRKHRERCLVVSIRHMHDLLVLTKVTNTSKTYYRILNVLLMESYEL